MFRKFIFLISFVLVLSLIGNAWAQNWAVKDIGGSVPAGSASYDGGIWTVKGGGDDIGGSEDRFYFVYRPLEGDGEMIVTLDSMTSTHEWQKVGLMIRETTGSGSKHFTTVVTRDHGLEYLWRVATGEGTSSWPTNDPSHVPPQDLKITRVGNTFTAYRWRVRPPPFPPEWFEMESKFIEMNNPDCLDARIGMVVCSRDIDLLCTAVFKDVTVIAAVYNKPWDLSPVNGATKVDLQPTLAWMAGDSATSHDVYLGPESSMVLVDTLPVGDESYTPPTPLAQGTTYSWQIVEQPGDVAGPVFSFSTSAPVECTLGIRIDIWDDIGGGAVADLTSDPRYPDSPFWTGELPMLDTTTDLGETIGIWDDYGGRMQGCLWPEDDGEYTFWIAADDGSELWLSTDEQPDNLVKIAYESDWTGYHDYWKFDEQESEPIPLVGGERYFIRALYKEWGGGEHCSVAWESDDAGVEFSEISSYYFASLPEASKPSPTDGTTLNPLEAMAEALNWTASRGATSQEVWFGDASGPMAQIATLPPGATSLAMPPIELDKTYRWQVNTIMDPDVYASPVWSFSVAEWVSLDIGTEGGSSSYDEYTGITTINADGSELWGSSDHFHYLFTMRKMLRDTGEIKVRVLSVPQTDSWATAGVMIRQTRAANSSYAMMANTMGGAAQFQYRWETGDDTGEQNEWDHPAPLWVKLAREGERFDAYWSNDGESWTYLGTEYIDIEPDKYVCVGLGVTSFSGGNVGTATFDNLDIWTPDPRQTWGPSPDDEEDWVPIHVTLGWHLGEGGTKQRLYFSENYEDVEDGTAFMGELGPDVTEWTPPTLDLTKTYYWAVDTDALVGRDYETILGNIWSFTAEPYRILDDFEDYDDKFLEELPEQVEIDPGYTIPGYTIDPIEPPRENLLVEYIFDTDDLTDTSNNGYHGIDVNDPCAHDGILTLDGTNFVDIPLGGDNPVDGSQNFSIVMEFRSDESGILASSARDDTPENHSMALYLWTDEWEGEVMYDSFHIGSAGTGGETDNGHNPGDGEWHIFVANYDADEEFIDIHLLDGEDWSWQGWFNPDIPAIKDDTFRIGGSLNATYPYEEDVGDFVGDLDNIRIYNEVITEEGEIRWLAGLGPLVVDPVVVPPSYGPLIAYYTFEDGAKDSSDNELHGTIMGDTSIGYDDDLESLVASFDGDWDCIDIGNDERFNPGTGDLSISVWINMSSYEDNNWGNVIVGKFGEGDGWQLRRLADTQRLSFTTRGGGDEDGWDTAGQDISLNEWHHVAAIREGTEKSVYIDGEREGVSHIDDYIRDCDHNVYIGARANWDNDGPESFFEGKIDELRIYGCALTEGQVLGLSGYEPDNPIADTWSGMGAASPELDYSEPHRGDKAMRVDYTGDGKVVRLAPFTDWTEGNTKAMVLYFKGDPCNTPEQMYVALADPDETVVLLDDGFEGTPWDANWEYEAGAWERNSAWPHVHSGSYSARNNGNDNPLTSIGLDTSDAVAINVDFWYQKAADGDDFRLYYYDGSNYNLVADLLGGPESQSWLHYTDTMAIATEPGYFVSDFKIRLEADSNTLVWIDDVLISKNPDVKVYYDYPEDLQIAEWQEWNIDLQDFSDLGEDLSNVGPLMIGFDGNPGGTVNIDDLRLMTTRCVLEYAPFGDITDDCVVDMRDLRVLAGDWLMGDATMYHPFVDPDGYTEPPRENLLVEYTFNTNDLTDTSDNGYHGIGQNDPSVHDGILTLDGSNFVDIPFNGNNPVDGSQDFSIVMEFRTNNEGILISSARDDTSDNHSMAVYMWTNEWEGELVYDNFYIAACGTGGETANGRNPGDGKWHIFAVTYDADEEFIDIHLWDGEDWSWQGWWNPDIPDIEDDTFRIGGSMNTEFPGEGPFVGDFDGIRIYDKVLTESEILWLADETDPKYTPLVSAANLYDEEPINSKKINFKDYAFIADEWLLEIMFP